MGNINTVFLHWLASRSPLIHLAVYGNVWNYGIITTNKSYPCVYVWDISAVKQAAYG